VDRTEQKAALAHTRKSHDRFQILAARIEEPVQWQ
jgi:hypothetical protein